jgi:hypothetical protein
MDRPQPPRGPVGRASDLRDHLSFELLSDRVDVGHFEDPDGSADDQGRVRRGRRSGCIVPPTLLEDAEERAAPEYELSVPRFPVAHVRCQPRNVSIELPGAGDIAVQDSRVREVERAGNERRATASATAH